MLEALRDKDAILFGSAGDPHIPDHVTLWGLRLKICRGFDQYAATARVANRPATLDTLVATNLHADILGDLAAALAGSLGIQWMPPHRLDRRQARPHGGVHSLAFIT